MIAPCGPLRPLSDDLLPTLPRQIAQQIELLREERLQAFAEMPLKTDALTDATPLEQRVDALLDSLYTLHRLEQLARGMAAGEEAATADLTLIAEHHETFHALLGRACDQSREPRPLLASQRLLPMAAN